MSSPDFDEDMARLILKLEGCTIQKGSQHKYDISHPNLVGISINCDKYNHAYKAFRDYFKVIE